MQKYLEASKYIDWDSEAVIQMARQLARKKSTEADVVRSCFEFVRDQIKHSLDHKLNPVTCKASDVLREGTGFCFAKSHLLAALLRANQIPAALVYQRIAFGEHKTSFYLHGLNAVFLNDFGWFRIDPRGLKEGLHSDFVPPVEMLPFAPGIAGEIIYETLWAQPNDQIIGLLESSASYASVIENLPGIDL